MSVRPLLRQLITALTLGAGLLSLAACSQNPETSKVSGEARVRLPWNDGQGEMKLQEVLLTGLENLLEVRGAHARFYFAPKILPNGLEGESPRARFVRTKSDLYVPSDELSQQMAVVYAHLQHLRELDQKAGLGNLLPWPRKVAIATRIRNEDGSLWMDNSFYDGSSDALLLVPNKSGRWPLAVNPGVIAHEHFHALYYKLVLGPLLKENVVNFRMGGTAHDEQRIRASFEIGNEPSGEKENPHGGTEPAAKASDPKVYNTVFSKVVNEGLADVWGWIYSGQPDFVGKSFPDQLKARSMRNLETGKVLSAEGDLKLAIEFCLTHSRDPDGCVNRIAYGPGSEISRALRSIFIGDFSEAEITTQSLRSRLAVRVAKSLPGIRDLIQASTATTLPTPEKVLRVILAAEEMTTEEKAEAATWISDESEKVLPKGVRQ